MMQLVKNLKDVLKDIDKDGKLSRYKNYAPKKKGLGSVDLFDFLDLSRSWDKIVGPRLSQFTIPLKLNNKYLTILTSHPVYAQQLKYMENEIIKSIGDVLPATQGHIAKVFFQVDNKYFGKMKAEGEKKKMIKEEVENRLHPQSPQYKAIMQAADNEFCDIADESLKESLKSLYFQLKTKK